MYSLASVDELVQQINPTMGAAEAHGILCGLLSVKDGVKYQEWLGHLDVEGSVAVEPADADDWSLLEQIYDETVKQFAPGEVTFQPLLLDDDGNLTERTDALAEWVQGYLLGLGIGGLSHDAEMSDELREMVKDFSEISQLVFDPEDDIEEGETAYMEIVEYVRVGALFISDELKAAPANYRLH